ncbi:MAG TPA: type II secretion system F family protein, partial [Candidatus Aquicultoraceae bacterium]|nr:type II secretion system F family protein [Candidatus Aquicultoraceae bacterium]
LLAAGGVSAVAMIAATRDPVWAIGAGFVPACLCGVAVRLLQTRRRKRIVAQLAAFLDVLAAHVKAGHSIMESLVEAVPLLPSGIREEASWICQTTRLGTPLPDTLRLWEDRMRCEEVSLIVRPLLAAIPVGGNLCELLTRCRDVLRMKTRRAEKLRSMTAQARVQALVLTFLPVGFVAILSKIDPGYLSRCLETAVGKAILSVAGILQLLGWIVIRRIMEGNR